MAQCGGPTTTQIANNRDAEGLKPITEFLAMTDHSVQLVDHSDNEHPWVSQSSGFGTTNWGSQDDFKAQAYTSNIGTQSHVFGDHPVSKSSLNLGFTSYFMQAEESLGDNQFFVGSPGGVNYYLPGCPNYDVGETSEESDFVCPRVDVNAGTYKFTILGLMSGSMINSLNTANPPATDQGTLDGSNNVERDIAQYKTMLYRSTLDLGAMGGDLANYTTLIIGGEEDGKTFDQVSSSADLAGSVLQVTGSKFGAINVTFSNRCSTGIYTRSREDVLNTFDGCQDVGNNGMDDCTRDLTGWNAAPDSFPDGEAAGGNDGVQKSGTKDMSREELGKLDGAPELKVTEVKSMKITMRKSTGCSNRPDTPAGVDGTGTGGLSWPGHPADCPPWYLSTSGGHEGSDIDWAVNYGDHLKTVKRDSMTVCESGSCYLIDFHIELGGTDEGSRTVFGNPANDQTYGWEKGTFFMYDPEVFGDGVIFNEPLDWLQIIVFAAAGFVVLGVVVTCCYCCKKRRKGRGGEVQAGLTGVQLA
ncbi:hypothetical protein TL16_g06856 [Triparma laevis f. inornata]|uniref:Uncharacterized protein n=1 Tax=Triparma laevis f. inornata TaxID=1714386 RepID=A0A9W7ASA6_9STRA|nr:hypothetical protein TL16_g06856 [Triparma laevis f. inornata]